MQPVTSHLSTSRVLILPSGSGAEYQRAVIIPNGMTEYQAINIVKGVLDALSDDPEADWDDIEHALVNARLEAVDLTEGPYWDAT